jgi:hypothetical protein
MPGRSSAIPISSLILTICLAISSSAQNSDPKFLSAPEFILSADAVAAGIDGVFKVTLSIDEAGNVKKRSIVRRSDLAVRHLSKA